MNLKVFNTKDEKKEECKIKCGGWKDCQNDSAEDHTCPFSEEINGDCESLCNCCDDCTHECAMDI
jgi:hypothetical protein